MFVNNILYEIKILLRSNWITILLASIALLTGFATYNGTNTVAKRLGDIAVMEKKMQQKDSVMLSLLDKIEKKEKLDIPYWQLPSEPMTVGYRYPRLAVMRPEKLSFIATGQSDMYSHFKSPTVYGNNFALDYAEMVNPIQLLFGNFDLAFVIIYILPLLIIAFSYNVLSKENELGTIRLLGSQPISLSCWLRQKMAIRFIIFTSISLLSILVSMSIFTTNILENITSLFGFFFITGLYIFFWFMVSYSINLHVRTSSKSALTLISVWLILVIIFPATINQVSTTLYPTPSRIKMINEIRQVKKDNEKKQNEILSDYLRSHPELTQEDEKQKFGFWHNYFASEKVLENKTKPLLAVYEKQLHKQQTLLNTFKFISPAILLQQSLNTIAGTSEKHYNDFKLQVYTFSESWRDYLVPMLFKNEKFSLNKFNELPKFKYENRISKDVWMHSLLLILLSFCVFLVLIARYKNRKLQQSI